MKVEITIVHDCTDKFITAFGRLPNEQYIAVLSDIAKSFTQLRTTMAKTTQDILGGIQQVRTDVGELQARIDSIKEQLENSKHSQADIDAAVEQLGTLSSDIDSLAIMQEPEPEGNEGGTPEGEGEPG